MTAAETAFETAFLGNEISNVEHMFRLKNIKFSGSEDK
jgi:hypothetical protein